MGINYLEKLNYTMYEMLEDLIKVFPNDGDFRIYLVAVNAALTLDEMLVYHIIQNKIMQHHDKIMAKDETFIVNFDIKGQIGASRDDVKETIVHVIQKLRMLWSAIGEHDKDIIWRYFKTMILLCQKVTI